MMFDAMWERVKDRSEERDVDVVSEVELSRCLVMAAATAGCCSTFGQGSHSLAQNVNNTKDAGATQTTTS